MYELYEQYRLIVALAGKLNILSVTFCCPMLLILGTQGAGIRIWEGWWMDGGGSIVRRVV